MKRALYILSLAILLIGCAKEEDPQFTTVRRILPIDGVYRGSFSLRCDSIGLRKVYDSQYITITSSSSESAFIDNGLCKGEVNLSQDGFSYTYGQMHWIDFTDCNPTYPVSFDFRGSGKIEGDSLKEIGWFIVYKGGRHYSGKWSTKAIRIK